MKRIILFTLIVGSCYFRIAAAPDLAKWSEDEIGERWVGRIREVVKEPFMTLLATSEFATKQELQSRIDGAQKALKNFQALVTEEMVPKQPATPAAQPQLIVKPIEAPVAEMPMPAAKPAAIPTPQPEAIVASPAPAMLMPTAAPTAMPQALPAAAPSTPAMAMPAAAPTTMPAATPAAKPVMVTPTVAEELAPAIAEEPAPVAAKPSAVSAYNRKQKTRQSIAKKFDALVVAERDESAQTLVPLKKEKKLTARQRYYKQAKTEKKPKIQAIHNEDEMNSI